MTVRNAPYGENLKYLEILSNFLPLGGSLTVKKLPEVEKEVEKNFNQKKSERLDQMEQENGW